MTTLLPASLQNSLQEIVQRSNQRSAFIRAILLSTTDGVPLGRVIAPTTPDSSSAASAGDGSADSTAGSSTAAAGAELSTLQEDGLASIESVWAPASKQFPVLGLDKVHQVTAIYDHGTLVHIYQAPLVITILCGPQSNLGAVRSTAVPLLKQVLEPLLRELVNSLQPDSSDSPFPGATFYH